jgi:hypothetical protein
LRQAALPFRSNVLFRHRRPENVFPACFLEEAGRNGFSIKSEGFHEELEAPKKWPFQAKFYAPSSKTAQERSKKSIIANQCPGFCSVMADKIA